MNDLITAATSGLFVEVGKVIEHMKVQQERIADLERQLAEASAPAVEQQPVAWIVFAELEGKMIPQYPAFFSKEQADADAKLYGQNKTEVRALYAATQAADTDKVREAVEAMNRAKLLPIWDNDVPHKLHVELDVIFKALSSMAAQAPVREVPEGWQLVPAKPTKEQRAILKEAAPRWNAESIYANLLDAAPAAPVQKEGA